MTGADGPGIALEKPITMEAGCSDDRRQVWKPLRSSGTLSAMEFHRIAPQRPCNIWTYSDFEPGPAFPRRFRRMVFAYDFPTEDCLLNDVPYYFVTKEVGKLFSALGLSGASREPVETRVSDMYAQSYATPASVPEVEQLIVTGLAGKDDFGLQDQVALIVSDRALALFRQHGLAQAQIFPYDPAYRVPTMEELLNR